MDTFKVQASEPVVVLYQVVEEVLTLLVHNQARHFGRPKRIPFVAPWLVHICRVTHRICVAQSHSLTDKRDNPTVQVIEENRTFDQFMLDMLDNRVLTFKVDVETLSAVSNLAEIQYSLKWI